jgi:diphosphomevalonate decarboxylase
MTAVMAHPNFASIKYWGKANRELNVLAAGSISVIIDKFVSRISVHFSQKLKQDTITLNNSRVDRRYSKRIVSFLDVASELAGDRRFAEVDSKNKFPTASGLASSSSGFAALALSASRAAGLNLSPNALSALARRGSGTAARSIHG